VRIRGIVFSLFPVQEGAAQLDLFVPEERLKLEQLQRGIDQIRLRFGRRAICVGRAAGVVE
jgi:hypothetical protein